MSEATPGREPESAPEEPRVIVDEDWKSRVQAEREAAKAARAAEKGSASQAGAADQAAGESPTGSAPSGDIPEASFAVLVNSLAVQAMACLGALPDPVEGHAVVRPDLAKHYIDTLSMLEAKTQGNLSAEESQLLTTALHQLRMLFISVSSPGGKPPGTSAEQA
mgnify:CR=1 FL=1